MARTREKRDNLLKLALEGRTLGKWVLGRHRTRTGMISGVIGNQSYGEQNRCTEDHNIGAKPAVKHLTSGRRKTH